DVFNAIAELLEIRGENPFRVRAYVRAAERIGGMQEDVAGLIETGRLEEIEGIGKDLAGKIAEIAATGTCRFLEELKKAVPEGVVAMLAVPGIGPRTAKLFFDKLGIRSVEALRAAARRGRLEGLPGIRRKTVDNILRGIELLEKGRERMDIMTAHKAAGSVIEALKGLAAVKAIEPAGSLRRGCATVRDVDILAASTRPAAVMEAFVHLPVVKRVLAHGATKSAILTQDDTQVDLRVVAPSVYGAALVYFTGSKNHNIKLRQRALKRGGHISEYGVFDGKGRRLAAAAETQVYRRLGLDYIPPEMREDNGEVEAAAAHRLPRLASLRDIRGDFHAHTNYSDGRRTPEEMAAAADALGYEYLCLTDHSVTLRVAHGLDEARLAKKRAHIDRLNRRSKGVRLLFATEAEIDGEGRIDYPEKILRNFDVVIGAVHSGFKQSVRQLTRRMVAACRNPNVHIIAHPTGRQWPVRPAYELDFKEVYKAAAQTNTALELNANPMRMDLDADHARAARDAGVRLAIGTDAHDAEHLGFMRFGVGTARRAWLGPKDILNTRSLKKLLKELKK
ncbi:MAG: DNA polymerase/3'-5' exonuclease PolX, partial [Deltaproteobacteria bacterium]